jgi:hypothetical protein
MHFSARHQPRTLSTMSSSRTQPPTPSTTAYVVNGPCVVLHWSIMSDHFTGSDTQLHDVTSNVSWPAHAARAAADAASSRTHEKSHRIGVSWSSFHALLHLPAPSSGLVHHEQLLRRDA